MRSCRSGYPTLHWVPSVVRDVGVQEEKTLVLKKEKILVEMGTHPRHSLVYLAQIVTFGSGGSQQNTDL